MKKYKAISFDAYNTIFNVSSIMAEYSVMMKEDASDEWFNSFWGRLSTGIKDYFTHEASKQPFEKTDEIYKYALIKTNLKNELTCSIEEAIKIIKLAHSSASIIPGILELIDHLKKNYRLVVVLSDSDTDVLKATLNRNLLNFDVILTSEIAKGYKPNNSNVFTLFQEITNCIPSEILHIGDSIFDIIGSTKVGFQACLFNPLSHLPEKLDGISYLNATSISDLYAITSVD